MTQNRCWPPRGLSRERVFILEHRGGGSNEELSRVVSSLVAGIRRPVPSNCRPLRTLIDILANIDMLSATRGLLHCGSGVAYYRQSGLSAFLPVFLPTTDSHHTIATPTAPGGAPTSGRGLSEKPYETIGPSGTRIHHNGLGRTAAGGDGSKEKRGDHSHESKFEQVAGHVRGPGRTVPDDGGLCCRAGQAQGIGRPGSPGLIEGRAESHRQGNHDPRT